jgi:hypothetical protein
MLADAIEKGQCGDLWDIIGFTEEEHARLPELLRAAAMEARGRTAVR